MTQVLAGAIGGSLALIGVFFGQWQASQRADREHLRRAMAQVFGDGSLFLLLHDLDRDEDSHDMFRSFLTAICEVQLLGSPAVRAQAQNLTAKVFEYAAALEDDEEESFDAVERSRQLKAVHAAFYELEHAVRTQRFTSRAWGVRLGRALPAD